MKIFNYPSAADWSSLMQRPQLDKEVLTETVSKILEQVRMEKDDALRYFSIKFDNAQIERLEVSKEEIKAASARVSPALQNAIILAKNNIEKFHKAQLREEEAIETTEGVRCWRQSKPIQKVGLYIPGGTAPLFSTILMLGIPAKLSGCEEIILCSPANSAGEVHPAILFTAQLVGITRIFKIGGAQAIAAMAHGTESIPKVYKIFGPGNQYVTKAKELVQQQGTAIDMPAGPSELLVIADSTGVPEFIASDLLSQAEHGADSQVILLSNDAEIIRETKIEIEKQLDTLPRKEVARAALENSRAILLKDLKTCADFSNAYAPEHLIIASENAENLTDYIINAGSVFLGNYSCESAGDYASGTNHTLPTNGFAKNYSGVSVESFMKKITFQAISKKGLNNIGEAIELMAEAEGLMAHKNAVSIRLKASEDV